MARLAALILTPANLAPVEVPASTIATALDVEVNLDPRDPASGYYTGTVNGSRFRYLFAMRQTAERERDAALARAAAWQALLDAGYTR